MTQNRNDRRAGPQSSARPRRPQTQNGSHRAYDWTQDRRASAPQRRTRPQAVKIISAALSTADIVAWLPKMVNFFSCICLSCLGLNSEPLSVKAEFPFCGLTASDSILFESIPYYVYS